MAKFDDPFNDYLADVSVMIVDDNDFTVKMIRQVIKVIGAQYVSTFNDARLAWKEYQANPCDLIILDWQMPGMNGIQFTKLVRNHEDSPNVFVPIIMVSAFRTKEAVMAARDAGVTEFVVKPMAPKALFERIEAVIEKPRRFVRVGEFFGPDRRRHKGGYDGDDRRGKSKPDVVDQAAAARERKRDMGQEEINKTFNPDDVKLRESAD